MISEDIQYAAEGIEEDLYLDPLIKLVDRLKKRSEVNGDVELMHLVHQAVLLREFTEEAFFQELCDRVQHQLSNPDSKEGSEIPVSIRSLTKALNGIDMEDLFNADYGFVDRSAASDVLAVSMGVDSDGVDLEEFSDSKDQLLNLLVNVLQAEYDNLNEEYQARIREMLVDIKEKSEDSQSPIEDVEKELRSYTAELHTESRGWPL